MKRILIVDDEKTLCDVLEESLSELGYRVTTTHSGVEAISFFEQERPDLVLLDITLEDADGLDILRRFKDAAPNLAVFIISAFHEEELAKDAIAFGATGFITKPLDLDQLEQTIADHLPPT